MEQFQKEQKQREKRQRKLAREEERTSKKRDKGDAGAAENSLFDIFRILARESKLHTTDARQRIAAELKNTSEETRQEIMLLTEKFGHKGSLKTLEEFAVFFEGKNGTKYNLEDIKQQFQRKVKLEDSKEEAEKKEKIKQEKKRIQQENEQLYEHAFMVLKRSAEDPEVLEKGKQNNKILQTVLKNYLPTKDVLDEFLLNYGQSKESLDTNLKNFLTPEKQERIRNMVGLLQRGSLFTGLPDLKLARVSIDEEDVEKNLGEAEEIDIEEEEDEEKIEEEEEEDMGDVLEGEVGAQVEEQVAKKRKEIEARLGLELEEEDEEERIARIEALLETVTAEQDEEDESLSEEKDLRLYEIFNIDRSGILEYAKGMTARKIKEQILDKQLANKYYAKCNNLNLKSLPQPFDKIAFDFFQKGSAQLLQNSYREALENFENCLAIVRKAMPKQNTEAGLAIQAAVANANAPVPMEVDAVLQEIQKETIVARERMLEIISQRLARWEISKEEAETEMTRVLVPDKQISYAESVVRASPWAYTRYTFSDDIRKILDQFQLRKIWVLPLNNETFRDLVGQGRDMKTIDGETYYKPIHTFFNVYLSETTEEADVISFGEYRMRVAYELKDKVIKHNSEIDYKQKQLFVERISSGARSVKQIWILPLNDEAKVLVNDKVNRSFGSDVYFKQNKTFYQKFLRHTVVDDTNVVNIAGKFAVKIKYELASGAIVDHDALINGEKEVYIAQIFASDDARLESLKNIPIKLVSLSRVILNKINFILKQYIRNETVCKNLLSECIVLTNSDKNGNVEMLCRLLSKVIAYLHFDYFEHEEEELKGTNFKRKIESNFYLSIDTIMSLSQGEKIESNDEKLVLYYTNREEFVTESLVIQLQNLLFNSGKFVALKPNLLIPASDILYITNVYSQINPYRIPVSQPASAMTKEQLEEIEERRQRAESVFNVLTHIRKAINYFKS